MTLPEPVRDGVEALLEERTGRAQRLRASTPLSGGCINPSALLETDGGERFFLKWNPSASPELFEAEADGLRALRAGAGGGRGGARPTLRVPEVLGHGGSGASSDPGWLLMEYVAPGSPGPDYGEVLGEGLARLHASGGLVVEAVPRPGAGTAALPAGATHPFGWHRDNFIGSLPQENDPTESWPIFWRDRRLGPQLRTARESGRFRGREGAALDEILGRAEDLMQGSDASGPCLLHGDLWSGNYYAGSGGGPVLIDPATYRGTGEVDLAMMELFGAFPLGFREAYSGVLPLEPAYDAFRRDLYQLYYLLVHVNLFGSGYVAGTLAAARRVLRGS